MDTHRTRLIVLLWLAGMAGVVSLYWMSLPLPEGVELPFDLWVVKLLGLIQPTLLLTLAVWAGVRLAPRVGLAAPAFEAFAAGRRAWPALRAAMVPGLVGGVLGGAVLVVAARVAPDVLVQASTGQEMPLATRMLYGGITEEVMLRWGLMTFLMWGLWRLLQNRDEQPRTAVAWASITLAALVFAAGHLPVAFALVEEVTSYLVAYILIGNASFGVIAGYLYWRWGLEAAILAHAAAHLLAYLAEWIGAV